MSRLKGKNYKDYNYTSRYSLFPYYYNSEDDKYVTGVGAYVSTDAPYIVHTVVQGDTLDNLALYYYNNPTYFWILCSFNRIRNPYIKLKIGQQLKIPSLSNITFDIQGRS